MAHVRKHKAVEWTKYIGSALSGIAIGAALLGVPKCSELQTVAAATSLHEELVKRLDEEAAQQREEHKDFRQAIQKNSAAISENMEKILGRLLEK